MIVASDIPLTRTPNLPLAPQCGLLARFEENLRAYLRPLVYGRTNERLREQGLTGGKKRAFVGGQKYWPRDDWTIPENAHPAPITPEIAAKIHAGSARSG
jgi:hypothetical protein